MPSNMFFTVTLPATLWFFDKQKAHTERKDTILFLDARNVYTQIDRAHREWKEEQIQNLAAIVRLYRGETDRYLALISHYVQQAMEAQAAVPTAFETLQEKLQTGLTNLQKYAADSQAKRTAKDGGLFGETKGAVADLIQKLTALPLPLAALPDCSLSEAEGNAAQLAFAKTLREYLTALKATDALLKTHKDALSEQAETLNEEQQRAAKNEMTEAEQKLFDLLKKEKLSKEEEKSVKLAAKNKILIQDRHKEKATQEKVRWEIQQILGHHLPEPGYDWLVFSQKVDVTFQHFYGLAQMGFGFVA